MSGGWGVRMTGVQEEITAVAGAMIVAYGITPDTVTRIRAGTATANYHAVTASGEQWFAKVYRKSADLSGERAAIELAEFARDGGVPVPAVRRNRAGDLLECGSGLAMSLWPYLAATETAEGGLTGRRWEAVGAAVGRLHLRLARHPHAAPVREAGAGVCDLDRSRRRYDRLIEAYECRQTLGPFEQWALEAARQRRSMLPQVAAILRELPEVTVQVLHGDLSALNLLLRGEHVAGFIDFQAPRARHLPWEIARIGCDPRTVLNPDQDWLAGFARLAAAYHQENPGTTAGDLTCAVAVGCAYTLASVYPLSEPLEAPAAVDASLQAYGRARHEAALSMLARLGEAEEALREELR